MKVNRAKWFFLAVIAMVMSTPAWALEFNIEGSYEIQGRYYTQQDIVHAKWLDASALLGATTVNDIVSSAGFQGAYGAYLQSAAGGSLTATQAAAVIATTAAAITDPLVPTGDVKDTMDSDQYLKHIFTISPELVITEDISVFADIEVFDNKINSDGFAGEKTTGLNAVGDDAYDSHNIFRVQNLWAEVETDFGYFVLGKHADFMGVGYFVEFDDYEDWTFGLIYNKVEEDSTGLGNIASISTDSDDADENAAILVAKYETDEVEVTGQLAYAWSGKDNGETSAWIPSIDATYTKDDLTLKGFFRYAEGTFIATDSRFAKEVASDLGALLALNDAGNGTNYTAGLIPKGSGYEIKDDIEWNGAWAAYAEASYDLDDLTPVFTLAYATGAEQPNEISGHFDDDQYFGTWLMNDVSDKYNQYFETPASNHENACGNPNNDDYSFTNIMLLRVGASSEITDDVTVSGNFIWAKKANTEYLEKYDTTQGILNLVNPDFMKVGGGFNNHPTTMKYKVDDNLGWELNAKAVYQVQDNFALTFKAAYFAPGDFYESAFEDAFGLAKRNATLYPTGTTGLEVEEQTSLRWIATVTF